MPRTRGKVSRTTPGSLHDAARGNMRYASVAPFSTGSIARRRQTAGMKLHLQLPAEAQVLLQQVVGVIRLVFACCSFGFSLPARKPIYFALSYPLEGLSMHSFEQSWHLCLHRFARLHVVHTQSDLSRGDNLDAHLLLLFTFFCYSSGSLDALPACRVQHCANITVSTSKV